MKLYFATSSLNIDNILSTESVAPMSFYQRRTYGYNTFCGLDLTPFQNVLVLFSKIPYFEIYDKEHDSRPMVCEIDINENINPLTYVENHEGVNVYSVDTVIRLSPFNTRLLFFESKDLNHSQLSCSDSLTNKLGDRFKFDLCKPEFDLSHLSNMKIHLRDKCSNFETKVLHDNRLNTIKGFVFGYYLGVSKSVSTNNAKLLRIQKRIYDIVATIKNSGGYGTNTFYDELEQLDREYHINEPSTRKCKDLWEKKLKELSIPSESLNKLLETYDEKSVLKNNFMRKNGLQPPVSLRQYGFNKIEAYRENLKIHTSNIIRNDQQTHLANFAVEKVFDLDPSYETCMLAGEDQDSMVFNRFIDAILWHGNSPTPDSLRTDRFNIATRITILAKAIWESFNWTWQESSAQIFMNELRQNIKSFTPLNIDKQENTILKSIAAFILKGEDYDSIVKFCEDNSYSDYRYALALWGATIGYVKMTKPIISRLSRNVYFSNVYKDILTLLYSIKIEGELPNIQEPNKIVYATGISGLPTQNAYLKTEVQKVLDTLTQKQKEANIPRVEQALSLEAAQGNFDAYLYILNNLVNTRTKLNKEMTRVLRLQESQGKTLASLVNEVLRTFTQKKDSEYRQKAKLALNLENKIGDPVSFCYILKGLNAPKDIRDKFFKHFSIKQKEQSLFDTLKEKFDSLFCERFNGEEKLQGPIKSQETQRNSIRKLSFSAQNIDAIAVLIRSLNPGLTDKGYEYIVNDLKWVFDPKYSSGKTEEELLETFRQNLTSSQRDSYSKNGKDLTWKNGYYKPIDIDKTIQALKTSINNE